MIGGQASPEDTKNYGNRFPALEAAGFYRTADDLTVSSLGIGTYLGERNAETDQSYVEAVEVAVAGGVNLIDTSLNYRHQRSERAVGRAITNLVASGAAAREELVVCTKAGFLTPGAVPPGDADGPPPAGGVHSMTPGFLRHQASRSRENLQLATIDVFYLHNPETQLQFVSEEDVYRRIGEAFQCLEEMVGAGWIRVYGAATWNAFREQPGSGQGLSLGRLIELAWVAGGSDHHFRFIQLPLNLAMPEGFSRRWERGEDGPSSVLELARSAGIAVVASATLLQGRLTAGLPEKIAELMPETGADAERAIQFTRSTPGVTAALVGMSRAAHVRANLRIATIPPLAPDVYQEFYR